MRPAVRGGLHAKGFVEGLRVVEFREVEVNVAQHRVAGEFWLRLAGSAQQAFEVQVICADAQSAVWVPPLVPRAVGVNLDAVSFRIVEIKGLAHEMVGGAGQRESLFEGPPEEAAQLLLARQKDREVKETGRVAGPLLSAGR